MAKGISQITSSITACSCPGEDDAMPGAYQYTWNDGIVASYLTHRVCRGLLVDLKKLIQNLDSTSQTGSVNSILWTRFSQRVADKMLGVSFTINYVSEKDDVHVIRNTHREFRYKDIDSIIEFFDETFAEQFSDAEIHEKIEPFLIDMIDGVGRPSESLTMFEGGMSNHTLIKKAMCVPCIVQPNNGRGFTEIGDESSMEGDYFSRKEIEIRSITNSNNQMESTYLHVFWNVMNRIVGMMAAATRVLSYHKLYDVTGEVDVPYNPPLILYNRPRMYGMSSSCLQSVIQLDGVFRKYEEKRMDRKMSILRSRSMIRQGKYRSM